MTVIMMFFLLLIALFLIGSLIFLVVCAIALIFLSVSVKAVSASKTPRKTILNILCSVIGLFLGLGIAIISYFIFSKFDGSNAKLFFIIYSSVGSVLGLVFGLINAKLMDSAIGAIARRIRSRKEKSSNTAV